MSNLEKASSHKVIDLKHYKPDVTALNSHFLISDSATTTNPSSVAGHSASKNKETSNKQTA